MAQREDRRRNEAGLRKKAVTLFGVILVIALVVGSLFGDRGILQLVSQRERAEALARELEEMREENRRLAQEIQALQADPRAIEKLAREQLGLARPGEKVFVIRDDSGAGPR
ncbi:MAG TPA: septum formation initiator family protein [Vicinamibacteria bacterium]